MVAPGGAFDVLLVLAAAAEAASLLVAATFLGTTPVFFFRVAVPILVGLPMGVYDEAPGRDSFAVDFKSSAGILRILAIGFFVARATGDSAELAIVTFSVATVVA